MFYNSFIFLLKFHIISGHNAAVLCVYTIVASMLFSALTLAEMTVLKCLYISSWSKMAMIEDDFLAKIITEVNTIITGICIFVRIYLEEPISNFHYMKLRGFDDMHTPAMNQWFNTINKW